MTSQWRDQLADWMKVGKRKRVRLVLTCATTVVVVLVFLFCWPGNRFRNHFGREVWWVLKTADRAEVYCLDAAALSKEDWRKVNWYDYAVGKPATLQGDTLEYLRDALLNPKHYDFRNVPNRCNPLPGFGARFFKGTSEVQILWCFDCKMISIAKPGQRCWEDFDLHGRKRTSRAFEAYLLFLERIFPEDKKLKLLNLHGG